MIEETLYMIFNLTFLSNEVWRYLLFIALMLMAYPIGKLIGFIINRYLTKWAEKTDIKFDDILVKSINPSINMFIFAGFFYLAASYLNQGAYAPIFQKIFNFLMIIPIVFFLIKFSTEMIGFYLKEDKKSARINEAAIDLLMSITRIMLFLIGIMLIVANLGYDVSALLAGLGIGGLAFALAAQDLLKNFFAGVSLIFDKTFNKKERVKFEGVSGVIEELQLRSTKIRTYDGTLLTIPNSMLAENIVENVTKVPKVKVHQIMTLTYNTSSEKLKEAKKIIEAAIKNEKYTDKKEYWVWFDNFNSYSLDVEMIYFETLTMDDWPERAYVKERVNFAIKEGFEKAKIEFAFPTQTVELKK